MPCLCILYFRLADPSMVNFSPQIVLNYVNYVRMLEYRKRLLEQQERLRNATLEAQKAGKQLVNQGQQVIKHEIITSFPKAHQIKDILKDASGRPRTCAYVLNYNCNLLTGVFS